MDTVEVSPDGNITEDGDYSIPGVKGTGSEIKVAFVDPAGGMTGELFPTGRRQDTITVQERNGTRFSVKATLIDAANPFVLVDASTLPSYLNTSKKDSVGYLEHMEAIRRAGAVQMGLASSTEAAAKVRGTPKLALLSPAPVDAALNGHEESLAINVLAFSMGKPHPSLQLTGAACLASAACIEGTIAHTISSNSGAKMRIADRDLINALSYRFASQRGTSPLSETPSPASPASEDSARSSSTPPSELLRSEPRIVKIFHSSGAIEVGVVAACTEDWAVVERCSVSRTARRLFDGVVYYYQ